VAFLDDDDEWLPGKLRQQLQTAAADGSDLVCCGALEDHAWARQRALPPLPPPPQPSPLLPPPLSQLPLPPLPPPVPLQCTLPRGWALLPPQLTHAHLAHGANPLVCSSVVVRRAALEARCLRFGDALYGQDYDLWQRCLAPTAPPSPLAATASGASGTAAEVDADGGPAASEGRPVLPPLKCSFVRACLVVVGTAGLERSTVRKEQRQAVRALLQGARAAPGAEGSAQSLINGFLGL
jgi:hypothetical protein